MSPSRRGVFVETYSWRPVALDREMEIRRYGRTGFPLLYAPSSGGDAGEFERFRFDRVAYPWIESGRVQVFAVDGRGPATWWNDRLAPDRRVDAYARVERYLKDEVLPWCLDVTGAGGLGAVGPSFGGFVAANLFLKRPATVCLGCGFGGVYGLWHRLDGHHDDHVYFHTPLEYLPGLDDVRYLGPLRASRGFDLYAAEDDGWYGMSVRMGDALRDRSIPHRLLVWPSPAGHHERWWREQWRSFLAHRFGAR